MPDHSTAASTFNVLRCVREWVNEDHESHVMTLVEDGSFIAYVRQAVELAEEAVLVRQTARRGHGYGWARFDALARKAGINV